MLQTKTILSLEMVKGACASYGGQLRVLRSAKKCAAALAIVGMVYTVCPPEAGADGAPLFEVTLEATAQIQRTWSERGHSYELEAGHGPVLLRYRVSGVSLGASEGLGSQAKAAFDRVAALIRKLEAEFAQQDSSQNTAGRLAYWQRMRASLESLTRVLDMSARAPWGAPGVTIVESSFDGGRIYFEHVYGSGEDGPITHERVSMGASALDQQSLTSWLQSGPSSRLMHLAEITSFGASPENLVEVRRAWRSLAAAPVQLSADERAVLDMLERLQQRFEPAWARFAARWKATELPAATSFQLELKPGVLDGVPIRWSGTRWRRNRGDPVDWARIDQSAQLGRSPGFVPGTAVPAFRMIGQTEAAIWSEGTREEREFVSSIQVDVPRSAAGMLIHGSFSEKTSGEVVARFPAVGHRYKIRWVLRDLTRMSPELAEGVYRMRELKIVDRDWEIVNANLRRELQEGHQEFEILEKSMEESTTEVSSIDAEVEASLKSLKQSEQEKSKLTDEGLRLLVQLRRAPKYRDLEASLQDVTAQLLDVGQTIQSGEVRGDALLELANKRDRLEAQAERMREVMQSIEQQSGHRERWDEFQARVQKADEQWLGHYRNYIRARSILAQKLEVLDGIEQRRLDVLERISRAEQVWKKLGAGNSPLIFLAKVTPARSQAAYRSERFNPAPVLRLLDRDIAAAGEILRQTTRESEEALQAFRQSSNRAVAAGVNLYVQIWNSGRLQLAVRSIFFLTDVVSAARNGGPLGALAEAARKWAEAAVFGEWEIADPSLVFQSPGLGGVASSLGEASAGAASEAGTAPAAGASAAAIRGAVRRFLETGKKIDFVDEWLHAWNENFAFRQSRLVRFGRVSPDLVDPAAFTLRALPDDPSTLIPLRLRIAAAELALARSRTNTRFQQAVETLRNKGLKGYAEDFGVNLLENITEEAIVQGIAEIFEGPAAVEYAAASFEAQMRFIQLKATIAPVNEAQELYEAMIQARKQMVQGYLEEVAMKVTRDEAFAQGTEVRIEVGIANPEDRELEVRLGGKLAQRSSERGWEIVHGELIETAPFVLDAFDLQSDASGGVALEIKVKK